jgi:hypothetical protein
LKTFFLVLARDEKHVDEKIEELKTLKVPYLIVCGKNLKRSNIVYRSPKGKYDAINFGARLIPRESDIVALNDVDTKIYNLDDASRQFNSKNVALIFAKVSVTKGPQRFFYPILDSIRRVIPITASGELMLIKRDVFERILPLKQCKAEDTYILFKALELKEPILFYEKCYAETERTRRLDQEEAYKRKTVCGIYQALAYTRPPILVRLFYVLLPIFSPLLLVLGKKGYCWMKGILLGLTDYLRGDRRGFWQPI